MQSPDLITLVEKTDSAYLRFLAYIDRNNAEKYKSRLKDPFSIEHFEVSRELEVATLKLFALTRGIKTELVLKGFLGNSFTSRAYRFLETDFVYFGSTEPTLLGELKITTAPGAKKRVASRQMEQRLMLANQRWPNIKGIVVCCSTAKFMGRSGAPNSSAFRPSFADAVADTLASSAVISTYDLDFQNLADQLLELKLLTESTLRRFRETFDQMKTPMGSPYLPSERADEINSLGNAFGDIKFKL